MEFSLRSQSQPVRNAGREAQIAGGPHGDDGGDLGVGDLLFEEVELLGQRLGLRATDAQPARLIVAPRPDAAVRRQSDSVRVEARDLNDG